MSKFTIIFCCLFILLLTACLNKQTGKGNSELERVAMHKLLNIPLVEAKVDGKGPFLFIVDTGASHNVFDIDIARKLNIKTGSLKTSRGATKGSTFTYAVAPEIEFTIGDLDYEARYVTVAPFLQTSKMIMGAHAHGILGKPLFNRYTVELDYDRDEVVFHDPNSFYYEGPGEILPITFRQDFAGLPAVKTTFETYGGDFMDLEILIDSGGGAIGISLGTESNFNTIIGPDAKRIPAMGATGLGNDPEMTKNLGVMSRLGKFNIGPFEFKGAMAGWSPDVGPLGVIGAAVLRRFRAIFDYKHTRMILEPNSDYESPFEDDKSGMFLTAASDDIEIVQVAQIAPGFAADKAGIRVGDRILSIDGKAASEITLNSARKLFMQEATYNLIVMRESDEIEITLRTEAL